MSFRKLTTSLLAAAALFLFGCEQGHEQGDGHDHGHDHGGGEEANHEEEEPPTLAITRWTDRYELFVELTAPMPGKPISYHAHMTRLSDFRAVTEGTFTARFKTGAGVAKEHVQKGVKRPGIFVFEGAAPAAGSYQLEMTYEHGGQTDTFDCGVVEVKDKPLPEEEAGATIAFLKESQWKVPFGTAWAEERPLKREMEIASIVEPAANDQLTVGAPTSGRFFHNPKLALAEGLRIKSGDILGTIAPTVAGDDYSRLQFAVEEARLEAEQTKREIARVEALVAQNLLPERRLIELQNELENHSARLNSAGSRLSRVVTPGGANGLIIKANIDGLISQVLVPNGEPVDAGAPLVRIGGTAHLWIRSRFVAKPASLFVDPKPIAVRLSSSERVDLEALGATFLSSLPVVESTSRIATWIVDVPPQAESESNGLASADLRPGASVVLSVRFGAPQILLAVPRDAVVEVNTRPYVFVQVDGEHFEKRAVTVGHTDGEFVHIIAGVNKGERVVTRGGFDVHLASHMGVIESHKH